ncbi:unnamed protein product [Linum trigynum]|uniref:Uncharacterized protein n=1 Tax=Linum trigynum TaxID=586398 RepID=A0AAV2E7X7_9ROSI
MAGINPHVPLHLAQAAIFIGKGFRSAEDYARYLIKFQDRPLCPFISLDPARFNRYDMNILGLINAVGWSDLPLDQCYSFRPEAVRMFYANMQPCFNTDPPTFTTVVYNYLLTISVDILSYLLGYPIAGAEVLDEEDFQEVGFNEVEAIRLYTRDTGEYYPSRLASGRLPDDLNVLLFFITCVFLPRSHVARVNLIDTLRAQFVLCKVHAFVRRRRPQANALVGDRTGPVVPAESLAAEPEDGPAVPAEILVDEPEDPEDGLSTADMEEELGGDEGEISDYLSSPTYPF